MKNYILFSFLVIVLSSCSNNRYLLNDKDVERKYLVRIIDEYAQKKLISNTPMLLIDGRTYRYKVELKKGLNLSKSNIKQISVLNHDIGTTLYGNRGLKGVVMITTYIGEKLNDLNKLEGKGLILCDGNVVDRKDLWNIKPLEVVSIEIINSKDEIAKHTMDNYQWVVVIKLKKK
jgi:hypothetical protein